MARQLAVLALALVSSVACARETPWLEASGADPFEPATIRALAVAVADWQLDHPRYEPIDWTNAVFYAGLLAVHRFTGEPRYLEVPVAAGDAAGWNIGKRIRHADDHAIAQAYLELFRLDSDPRRIQGFQSAIDRMLAEPSDWRKPHQTIDYWWCDALFMSPPALAKLAAATGEAAYLDLLDRLWREAHELLFDETDRLFHRDLRFRIDDGAYWARGNGWVLAGLARLLDELPEKRASRDFYETIFRELAERVVELQGSDGLWRADLMSSDSLAPGESSASALFCFALAWGIERGLLERDEYLPAVESAWRGLAGNVERNGRLGWVQEPGAKPGRVSRRHAEVYGSGAFLLAAEQMLALAIEPGS